MARRQMFLDRMDSLISSKRLDRTLTHYYYRGKIRRLSCSFSAMLLDGCIVDETIISASSDEFDSDMYQNQNINKC